MLFVKRKAKDAKKVGKRDKEPGADGEGNNTRHRKSIIEDVFHEEEVVDEGVEIQENVGKPKMSTSIATDPSKVQVVGTGLHFGYINHDIEALIDTRGAGPGELTVYCEGPENNAYCELRDHDNGTFTLVIQAQDVGSHELHIKYDNLPIPGSPFSLRVSPAGFVKIRGPGLDDGILHNFQGEQGEFIVDTHEAGPGEIKFKVGGPRGAFKVNTRKMNRNLVCWYNPREPGVYFVHVFWSGDHVPGSPFKVFVARDRADLERYRQRKQITTHV